MDDCDGLPWAEEVTVTFWQKEDREEREKLAARVQDLRAATMKTLVQQQEQLTALEKRLADTPAARDVREVSERLDRVGERLEKVLELTGADKALFDDHATFCGPESLYDRVASHRDRLNDLGVRVAALEKGRVAHAGGDPGVAEVKALQARLSAVEDGLAQGRHSLGALAERVEVLDARSVDLRRSVNEAREAAEASAVKEETTRLRLFNLNQHSRYFNAFENFARAVKDALDSGERFLVINDEVVCRMVPVTASTTGPGDAGVIDGENDPAGRKRSPGASLRVEADGDSLPF